MITEITEANFDETVLNSELPVVIDFYADWCGPCTEMLPTFEAVAERFEGRVRFGRVDTSAEKKLRIKFAIASLPTITVVRGRTFIDVADGLMPAEELEQRIERVLTGELDDALGRKLR